jgi:hypothetical protein
LRPRRNRREGDAAGRVDDEGALPGYDAAGLTWSIACNVVGVAAEHWFLAACNDDRRGVAYGMVLSLRVTAMQQIEERGAVISCGVTDRTRNAFGHQDLVTRTPRIRARSRGPSPRCFDVDSRLFDATGAPNAPRSALPTRRGGAPAGRLDTSKMGAKPNDCREAGSGPLTAVMVVLHSSARSSALAETQGAQAARPATAVDRRRRASMMARLLGQAKV